MNKEKFYQFLATISFGLMLILAIADRWDSATVALALLSVSSFAGIAMSIASFVGRILYKTNMPYYLDFIIFAVGAINVVNKFFALF